MECNLEIHLEEVFLEEIRKESHLSIHTLDLLDGQHLICVCLYHHGINRLLCNMFLNQPPSCHIGSYNTQLMSKILIQMLTLEYSKRPLKLMVKQWKLTSSTCLVLLARIISLNGVKTTFKTIPNCIFKELEQAIFKQFIIIKNDEEVHMQLRNIQQKTTKRVEVYYEHLLKLANCLQGRTTYVFLTIVFKAGLYLT